ncbi:hypothetical protein Q3G72_009646 [Acer saccharum]|nr:hypothetical protein Q3G72_009646 [Acer saccharum]
MTESQPADENPTRATTTDPLTNAFGSLNDLAPDLASLQDLATRGSWRSILDKVSRARSGTASLLTQPHHHLTYLSYNTLALTKLRRFDEAAQELDSLEDLDSSSYKYESYPVIYSNRTGSMVPFSLRWLYAIVPVKLGNRQEGLDRFYTLLGFVREKLIQKGAANLQFGCVGSYFDFKTRVYTDANRGLRGNKALMYLVGKDYVSAVREYDECIERDYTDMVAINNKALCLMYLRDLSDSIKVMENALERVPTVALNETLVVNLCSMYELAYVNHSDVKRTLSSWIAKVAPDDFDSSCTRI